jgi:hypothetical protein
MEQKHSLVPSICGPLNDLLETAATIAALPVADSAVGAARKLPLAVALSTSYHLQFRSTALNSRVMQKKAEAVAAAESSALMQPSSSALSLSVVGYSEGILMAYVSQCNAFSSLPRLQQGCPQFALDKKGNDICQAVKNKLYVATFADSGNPLVLDIRRYTS